MNHAESFFKAVLGDAAASALMKAGERSPALGSALLPRGVFAWLQFAANWNYEGAIPGLGDSYIEFAKSGPDAFEGFINVGDAVYDFSNAPLLQIAAAVSVALGADKSPVDPALKKADLQSLGANIDLLVKARFLNLMVKAEESPEEGCMNCSDPSGYTRDSKRTCMKCDRPFFQKVELPGKANAPTAPEAPKGQLAPQSVAPSSNKKGPQTAKAEVRITKSEADYACSVCDGEQFTKGKFTGCYCLRDLAKHTKTEADAKGYVVKFDSEWSDLDIELFKDIVKGKA